MLLSPRLWYKKPDPKELHCLVKGSQPGESDCLGPSSASCVNLGKVLVLFVSHFLHLKKVIIVPALEVAVKFKLDSI